MDLTEAVVWLILSVSFICGVCISQDQVIVREGGTVILNCSGKASKSVWYVSWAILRNNGSRTDIATCYRRQKSCNEDTACEGQALCSQQTYIEKNVFTSQLRLQVTADLRQTVIECVLGDMLYYNSNEIVIMHSYSINVYQVSDTANCTAVKESNHISLSCHVYNVYPDIICRIFPEVESNISASVTDVHVTTFPELTNVTYTSHLLAGDVEYYHASCMVKYYPIQIGSTRFHVKIYSSENLFNAVVNTSSQPLHVNSIHDSNQHINMNSQPLHVNSIHGSNQQINDIVDKHTLFYMLIGSILMFGVTVFLIMSWLVWTTQKICRCSPNSADENGKYESIDSIVGQSSTQPKDYFNSSDQTSTQPKGYFNSSDQSAAQPKGYFNSSDEGYGEASIGDIIMSDFANDDVSSHRYLDERGYVVRVAAPKSHVRAVPRRGSDDPEVAYIVPSTPTLNDKTYETDIRLEPYFLEIGQSERQLEEQTFGLNYDFQRSVSERQLQEQTFDLNQGSQ